MSKIFFVLACFLTSCADDLTASEQEELSEIRAVVEEDYLLSFPQSGVQQNQESISCMTDKLFELYGDKEILQASKENRPLNAKTTDAASLGTFSCMDDALIKINLKNFGASNQDVDCAFEELGRDKLVEILETEEIEQVQHSC